MVSFFSYKGCGTSVEVSHDASRRVIYCCISITPLTRVRLTHDIKALYSALLLFIRGTPSNPEIYFRPLFIDFSSV